MLSSYQPQMLLFQHRLANTRAIEAQSFEVCDAFRLNDTAEFEAKTTEAEWSVVAKVANLRGAYKRSVIMMTSKEKVIIFPSSLHGDTSFSSSM